jgi:hypothetical protein
MIQNPGSGRGAVVIRIQDPEGGAEGYTFDLLWRGTGFDSSRSNQPFGGRDINRGASQNDMGRACQDAVRERAYQQYGVRDVDFTDRNADYNQGRRDTITGSFDVRQGDNRGTYRFSCAVDLASGRVRQVEISQGRSEGNENRYSRETDFTSACQRAVEERIARDGYRNVQFGSLNSDNRRNDWIGGTATAQRGNNGRSYDFDVSCSVNPDNGTIRSAQAHRR